MIPQATKSAWEKIGYRHHHGICLPLAACRNSFAVGEYLDLIPLIDWCSSLHFDVIQLLPLNDSGGDPSPYSAHTAMGLHPLYLSLSALPSLELFPELMKQVDEFKEYGSLQRVRYHEVLHKKELFLRKYVDLAFSMIRSWPYYLQFLEENRWLEGYAIYKSLKEAHQEKPWWEWEEELQNPTSELLTKLKKQYADDIQFHITVQFLCFDQFRQVKERADLEGIFLKGDIPILINRDSADVWLHRELFLLDYAAGAPPDMYNHEGQYWGFPLYNWQKARDEKFAWWKMRLQTAQKLYHLYRIDHIVGFFKIWAIPLGKKATEGFFFPQDESLWIPQGEEVLRMMTSSCSMLPIGEDLGAVPESVRACMKSLGISGTKVLRWERKWYEDQSFIDPASFDPLSMSCVSTHDSETLSQWWKNHPEETCRKYPYSEIVPRKELLKECHLSGSLFHINLLQEYLGQFPELSWDNPDDERINIPGLVLDRNWTYRFRPTIQEIITHKDLRTFMKELCR